jgi:ABC-type glycerol-3-phosphate transport system substrate-binding protein
MTRRLGALVACIGVLAAACGSGKSSSTSTTTTAALAKLGGTVEVAASWTGQEQASFAKVLELFTQKTGIKATYTSTGDETATILGTRLQGGNPPDVAMLPQPGLMNDLAGRGQLQAIDDVGALVDAHYAPVWRKLGMVGNKLYGVWFKAANKSTVWYRTKAFSDAGVQPPTDFDAWLKDAQTLSDAGTTPFALGGAQGWTLTDWFENVYLRSAGPDKYDQLAAHTIPWTDPTVKDALRRLASLWKPAWIAGGVSGALASDFPKSVTTVFADNKAAMVYEGDFAASVISKETPAKVGTDAKYFLFPAIGSSGKAVMGGGDIAVQMKPTAQAKELMKFLASPEAGDVWAKLGGFTSPNKDVPLSSYADPIARQSATDLTGAQTFRFDLSDLTPAAFGGTDGQGEWKLLQDFLRDPSNIDGTAAALEAAAAAAYKK